MWCFLTEHNNWRRLKTLAGRDVIGRVRQSPAVAPVSKQRCAWDVAMATRKKLEWMRQFRITHPPKTTTSLPLWNHLTPGFCFRSTRMSIYRGSWMELPCTLIFKSSNEQCPRGIWFWEEYKTKIRTLDSPAKKENSSRDPKKNTSPWPPTYVRRVRGLIWWSSSLCQKMWTVTCIFRPLPSFLFLPFLCFCSYSCSCALPSFYFSLFLFLFLFLCLSSFDVCSRAWT